MTVDGNLFVSWKCENISQSVADQGPKELDPGLFPLIILVPHKGCKSHLCQLTIVLPMGRMLKYCCCCSIIKSCPTLCDPMDFPILHYLLEFAQTHVHWVDDAIQLSHHRDPLLLLPSVFPSIRVFSNELALRSGGQSIGASTSASIFPMNIQGWFPLGLARLISSQSKELSRVFSSTTNWKHQLFGTSSYWKD